jgi:hypothetical protein
VLTVKPICLVVKTQQHDKSSIKLIKQLQELGADCISAERAPIGCFSVGWGKAGRIPGLNCMPPRNKLTEIQVLRTCGVKTVPFEVNFQSALRTFWRDPQEKPATILGRRKTHQKGKDILEFELTAETLDQQLRADQPQRRDFWTLAVSKVSEYRVHAFCGHVECVATKVPNNEQARTQLIWNQENCTFDYDRPAPEVVKRIAVAAVRAYGADFGAVDVLGALDGEYYVLEVNLRPGLNDKMVLYYARQIVAAAVASEGSQR